ncbi:MAG: hypothetical protein ABS41_12375 [Arenimonas sp. SCN 70-307]|uniref:hypothetical protein n=1 Tax=Arenimonas sp. SCN 70-307 TaxID=1660089 RepID=UPI00086AD874|nr:hypothetical protein [Arenimonas sp. SCN 70-307]ODS61651.1 MAG: hypothetical protein ABS41_12375 [Arenimonas sp. SCN 70-307]
MDEMVLAGILLIVTALPGIAIGLMLLTGKWDPVSIRAAKDPARARLTTARLLLAVDALLVLLGIALMVTPREHGLLLTVVGVGLITLVTTVLGVAAVKANKA